MFPGIPDTAPCSRLALCGFRTILPRLAFGLLSGLTLAAGPLPAQQTLPVIDSIAVDKSLRKLFLVKDGETVRSYVIALGLAPKGRKLREGDYRTPEGDYRISARKPDSRYMLALQISYPDKADRARAARSGVSPGGLIMIHGRPVRPENGREREYYASRDWTDGCIAVSNAAMLEIWMMTPVGTPISIRP